MNKPQLPDFIQNKINHYIENYFDINKNGKHLVLGKQASPDDIILQSNDYLALANHPLIKARLAKSLLEEQQSLFMSASFLQNDYDKPMIEKRLAKFTGFDECLLSQSGWNANVGLLQTICQPNTNVYIDFFAHMSLWEGARYANAQAHPFMHNNCDHLRMLIQRHGPGIIVVDSIYSTLGTIAPLAELVNISKEFGCALLVDESHSLGTHGPNGAGLLAELGLTREVHFMTASLAKTFAYRAGAIWCNNEVNRCVPFISYPAIFSSTLLPYEAAGLETTLEIIESADNRRQHLDRMARKLRIGLSQLGLTIRSESQIIGLETGDERNTEKVRDYLESNGVFGSVFCRPATSKNKNIIRLSLNSDVNDEQIAKIIEVCSDAVNYGDFYFR